MTYESSFAALADPTRRRIFEIVAAGPRSVGEIGALVRVSGPAVSQHLARLTDARLVDFTSVGTRRIYQANPEGIDSLREWLDQIWDAALNNLKTESEEHHGKSGK
jgi:DNA-binding transcriptional ArsR family regulator